MKTEKGLKESCGGPFTNEERFEGYVTKKLLPDTSFIYQGSGLFRDRLTAEFFKVICQYYDRMQENNDQYYDSMQHHDDKSYSINWCGKTKNRLKMIKELREKSLCKYYLALGFGGKPDYPERIFFIDLDKIKTCNLCLSVVYEAYELFSEEFGSLAELRSVLPE